MTSYNPDNHPWVHPLLDVLLRAGLIVVLAGWSGVRATLDAAIVIALIGFLGTVAYATYVERGDPQ